MTYTSTLSLRCSWSNDQSPVAGSSLVERTPSDLRPISTRISSWSIRTITPSTTSPRLILMGVVDDSSSAAISLMSSTSSELVWFRPSGSFPSNIVCTRPLVRFAAGIVERSPCCFVCMSKLPPSICDCCQLLRCRPFSSFLLRSCLPAICCSDSDTSRIDWKPGDASMDTGLSEEGRSGCSCLLHQKMLVIRHYSCPGGRSYETTLADRYPVSRTQ